MQRCPHHPRPPIEFGRTLALKQPGQRQENEDFLYRRSSICPSVVVATGRL
jgi:hypothetical protein